MVAIIDQRIEVRNRMRRSMDAAARSRSRAAVRQHLDEGAQPLARVNLAVVQGELLVGAHKADAFARSVADQRHIEDTWPPWGARGGSWGARGVAVTNSYFEK